MSPFDLLWCQWQWQQVLWRGTNKPTQSLNINYEAAGVFQLQRHESVLRYENQRERAAVLALVCLPVLTRSSAVRLLVVGVFDWLKTQQPVYLRWRPNCWVMQTLRKPFTVYFLRMSPGHCAALRCDVKEFEKPSAVTTQLVWSNHLKQTCSQSEPISTERLRTI